jgi:hypothetical protein
MTFKHITLTISFFLLAIKTFGQYCTNEARYTDEAVFDSTEITTASNVQFGTALDHLGSNYALKMDIYYPNLNIDTSPKRPFVMLFHGGGFSSGDKQSGDIQNLCFHLARRGFVCATVNYRLGYDFTEFGQYKARYRAIQDGHAALRYIVNNANTIRIDTSWIFVGGQSAGSLLALGMVYADQSELDSVSLLYNTTSTSAELGNLHTSGNNLTNSYTIKGIFNNWGAVNENEIDNEEMLPTIAFHGEQDATVLIDKDISFLHYTLNGSRAIHNTLIAKNICSEITIDTAGDHGIYRNESSVFRASRASCFFKSIFCNTCSNVYTTDSISATCSSSLSINEKDINSKINIYPNPFKDSFRIDGFEGEKNIKIHNSLGQLIFTKETVENDIKIDLLPGIYFLTLQDVNSNNFRTTLLITNK